MRKFEKISYSQFEKDVSGNDVEELYSSLIVPARNSKNAAGYDFYAPFSFTLEPSEIIKIPTGIKAAMEDDEFLMIVVRSSVGFKYNVRMCNQVGIIDADYFNNEDNEGHIWVALQNEGDTQWIINKGDRIVQGIFVKYMLVDNEDDGIATRKGGLGSTGKGE
ncbi:MAG TPA: deoxyuridine 5'-triphosphate nucleotidohydrolase [Mollicutes bacterium]|jgi:dUTP pyrophosphatase|nr:deoxyuridine 5'-triphosphate nucleotidohydrolase [Mollicutes bacterium]